MTHPIDTAKNFAEAKAFVRSCLERMGQTAHDALVEQTALKVLKALPTRSPTSWTCPRCGKTVMPHDGSECRP